SQMTHCVELFVAEWFRQNAEPEVSARNLCPGAPRDQVRRGRLPGLGARRVGGPGSARFGEPPAKSSPRLAHRAAWRSARDHSALAPTASFGALVDFHPDPQYSCGFSRQTFSWSLSSFRARTGPGPGAYPGPKLEYMHNQATRRAVYSHTISHALQPTC